MNGGNVMHTMRGATRWAFSVVEIAELLELPRPALYVLKLSVGKLRIIKKGGRLFVLPKDVQRYLSRDDRDAPKANRVSESKSTRRNCDQAEIKIV